MTVESRCRALRNGRQCQDIAEDGAVLCTWHHRIIDTTLISETDVVMRMLASTIMDEGFSRGMKECSWSGCLIWSRVRKEKLLAVKYLGDYGPNLNSNCRDCHRRIILLDSMLSIYSKSKSITRKRNLAESKRNTKRQHEKTECHNQRWCFREDCTFPYGEDRMSGNRIETFRKPDRLDWTPRDWRWYQKQRN